MMGTVTRYEVRAGAEAMPGPQGEARPPGELFYLMWRKAGSEAERALIIERAEQAHAAWVKRPEPPPEGETLDELEARVLSHEGWEAKDVAMALRCTPTFVRRVRLRHDRSMDTGKVEGSLEHARELLDRGYSLRQVAMLTGIPKSTLHEALDRAA